MGQGTGVDYPQPVAEWPPSMWDYTECMEVDGQFFYRQVKAASSRRCTVRTA